MAVAKQPEHVAYTLRWDWARFVMTQKLEAQHAKVLAQAIAYSVNRETGRAWPSQRVLALRCGVSARHIRTGLAVLEEAGLILDHQPNGGLQADGNGGTRGRTGEYELLRLDEVEHALAVLDALERGTTVPPKPGTSVPAKPGTDTPPNLEQIDGQRGTQWPLTRNGSSDNLKSDLKLYPKTDLNNEAKHIDESEESSPYFPGIDYASIDPATPWPDVPVRKPNSEQNPLTFIGHAAISIQGFKTGYGLPAPKIGDVYADAALIALFPEPALAEMVRRCRAGTLNQRHVAMALQALNAPRPEEHP